jgi:GNAT superfamily N-acetyltransferase
MDDEIEIRMAEKSDLPALTAMLVESDPEDYVQGVVQDWVGSRSVYLATRRGAIAGMSHFRDMPDGSVWLSGLRVARGMRRSGVGFALTQFAVAAEGKTLFRLMISNDNQASTQMSEKAGFRRRCGVSLWRAETQKEISPELIPMDATSDSMEYIRRFSGMLPTAWYAFDPASVRAEDLSAMSLSVVADELGSVFLMNGEQHSLTPMHLEGRNSFDSMPAGYILLAGEGEQLESSGLRQSLWTKDIGIYEYCRKD